MTHARLFGQLELGLGKAAGPGTKWDAGAAAGGPRCGGSGGGGASSTQAVRSRGERAAAELVLAP